MTGAIAVRARVPVGAGAKAAHFGDPLLEDLAHHGPLSTERFGLDWSDTAALAALAEQKRAPLPAALAAALLESHQRLGASARSLESLDRLARGQSVAVVAGQQPAPLGGPLYSLHKAAAAAGLSTEFTARTGMPCVPLFWMHGEDSDFEEIHGALIADRALTQRELALPAAMHREGGLVGALATGPLEELEREALAHWDGLPGVADVRALLAGTHPRARDLGECMSALMLALFAEQGMVVVDPRLPAFRAAAREVIERYLDRADEFSAAARRAGAWLESRIGRRALTDAALDSFVFAVEDGVRHKISAAEARGAAHLALSPSVALRPVVQDAVLPTVAMACGPGEIAYLLQLREVFDGLAVRAACPVPRFAATWLPPAAVRLIEASGADAADVVTSSDAVLHELAKRSVPGAPLEVLERAHREAIAGLERVSDASRTVDASLPQMVESARTKLDFQYQRLREGIVGKVRKKVEHQHPEWLRLRYYLLPGDKWQERRLASLEVAAYRGKSLGGEIADLAADHARRLTGHVLEHFVVEL